MPKDESYWEWEEAFNKFGFGDGDGPQHNEDVAETLREMGWSVDQTGGGLHNPHICEISKGGKTIEIEGHEDNGEIRKLLPEDVVAELDKAFPPESAPVKPEVRKLWVAVEVFQGIVHDVHLFTDYPSAAKWFHEYTGVVYASQDETPEDFDQTKLFELEVLDANTGKGLRCPKCGGRELEGLDGDPDGSEVLACKKCHTKFEIFSEKWVKHAG